VKKTLLLILFFRIFLNAEESYDFIEECNVPYGVMLSIANVEKLKNTEAGYPYVISFNNKSDYKKAKEMSFFNEVKDVYNERNIDCIDKQKCIKLTINLVESNITNLDLGAYQINMNYHKLKISDYFSLSAEYLYACSFLNEIYKRKGKWDWETVATYHSSLKKRNLIYQKLLQKSYKSLTRK